MVLATVDAREADIVVVGFRRAIGVDGDLLRDVSSHGVRFGVLAFLTARVHLRSH